MIVSMPTMQPFPSVCVGILYFSSLVMSVTQASLPYYLEFISLTKGQNAVSSKPSIILLTKRIE